MTLNQIVGCVLLYNSKAVITFVHSKILANFLHLVRVIFYKNDTAEHYQLTSMKDLLCQIKSPYFLSFRSHMTQRGR